MKGVGFRLKKGFIGTRQMIEKQTAENIVRIFIKNVKRDLGYVQSNFEEGDYDFAELSISAIHVDLERIASKLSQLKEYDEMHLS